MNIREKLNTARRLYRDYIAQVDECETNDPVVFKHYEDSPDVYGRYDFMKVRPDLKVSKIRLSELVNESIAEIERLDALIKEGSDIDYRDGYPKTNIYTYLNKLKMEVARREQMRR